MRLVNRLVIAAVAIAVGAVAWQQRNLAQFRERARIDARRVALSADSIEAARDSSRAVLLSGAESLLGDSLRVYQRRIVQVGQRADSLDRALGLERAARYRVEATIAPLRERAVAAVVGSPVDSVRSGAFSLYQPPFHVEAAVALPVPPAEGRMDIAVQLDTAVLEARVGCGAPGVAGVRPATLSLAGPAWAHVRIMRVEQEAQVCSALPQESRSFWSRMFGRIQIGAGYSAVVSGDGRIVRGPGVGVGWAVWP